MLQNRLIALGFRCTAFVVILSGILIHLGLGSGFFFADQLLYYTLQSNILALFMFGYLIIKTADDFRHKGKAGSASYCPRFEMVCVVYLLLTLILYWVLLAPRAFTMGVDIGMWTYSNLVVHLLTPLLCIIDYFLFSEPGRLKYQDVYAVLIYPVCYVIFAGVVSLTGHVYRISLEGNEIHFPYFFIDFEHTGLMAIAYIVGITVFFLIISHGFYYLDRRRSTLD